jgi:transcriptional regulator of acetoin/glycerol metabolism
LRELARQHRDLSEQNRRLREELERRREGDEANVAPPLTLNLNAVKEQLIGHALQQTQGNITAAARILGVHRSWFYRRKAP